MEILLYSLSFIPMLLLTLVVHEAGHLVTARIYGVKVNAFQIGIGWTIRTFYTGRTPVRLNEKTRVLNPDAPTLKTGDITSVYVTRDDEDEHRNSYTAIGILPRNNGKNGLAQVHWPDVRRHNQEHPQLTGRVREIQDDEIILADMGWSIRAIPLMAGVLLPEDPNRRMKNVYNTVRWYKQAFITLAGPWFNLALMMVVLMALAISPITQVNVPAIIVSHVEPQSPAEQAGIQLDDRIVRIGRTLYPESEQIREHVQSAAQTQKPLNIHLIREGVDIHVKITPDPTTSRIGIGISRGAQTPGTHSYRPGAVAQRFASLGKIYLNSFSALARSFRDRPDSTPVLSGPVMGAYETAQAVKYAGPKAWLLILALFNLGVAFLNLLPIPPLDGFRIITEGIQALRHGKPMNPKLEHTLTMGGLFAIWSTGIYLVVKDIFHLLE